MRPGGHEARPGLLSTQRPRLSARRLIAITALAVLLLTGCDTEEPEKDRPTGERPLPKEPARAITFRQVTALRFGTPRTDVVKRIGPPVREQKVKPLGVVATCYRYHGLDERTGKIDPNTGFRLCYNRRDRLSLKSTAPVE